MKQLKTVLLLLCIATLLFVSCDNNLKEAVYENPDYNDSELDFLTPDPIRQEIEIYWTYEGDPANYQNLEGFTFDVKDQTIGFQGKAKDVVIQTIKPERMTIVDGKCYFKIVMGLNYTIDDHDYQVEVKVRKNKTTFAKSDVTVSRKTAGSRLVFDTVVKLVD